jgi:Sec-independent protein translocase protein TatA
MKQSIFKKIALLGLVSIPVCCCILIVWYFDEVSPNAITTHEVRMHQWLIIAAVVYIAFFVGRLYNAIVVNSAALFKVQQQLHTVSKSVSDMDGENKRQYAAQRELNKNIEHLTDAVKVNTKVTNEKKESDISLMNKIANWKFGKL